MKQKIKINRGSLNILVESNESLDKMCEVASRLLKECNGTLGKEHEVFDSLIPEPARHVPTPEPEHEFAGFRDRLPNNVVDISKLTVKQAIKEEALVRCPKCGQAHVLVVQSDGKPCMMRRNFIKHNFGVIFVIANDMQLNGLCYEEKEVDGKPYTKNDYLKEIQDIKIDESIDIQVEDESEIFCPVCHESSTFMAWKSAWETPLEFFETENLCDACGGEMLPKIEKASKFEVCDKCGRKILIGVK